MRVMDEGSAGGGRPSVRAVVCIPVRDEAERIASCLRALDDQAGVPPGSFEVLLFLNGCQDETKAVVAALTPELGIVVRVIEADGACDAGGAGWARRSAMEAACAELEGEGSVLLTTDADSCVPRDWIIRNLAAIAAGADAVAGCIALDVVEAAALPCGLHARGALEGAYGDLLTELGELIRPCPHDPWPRHATASGASLAVRVSAYRAVGGMPPIPVGEDRAFVDALISAGARVRHDPEIVVTTSARLQGRAEGGAADTIRIRCQDTDSLCDDRLEPFGRALLRIVLGRRAGARLAPRPLRPSQLPAQIRRARLAVHLLRRLPGRPSRERPADTRPSGIGGSDARTAPSPG